MEEYIPWGDIVAKEWKEIPVKIQRMCREAQERAYSEGDVSLMEQIKGSCEFYDRAVEKVVKAGESCSKTDFVEGIANMDSAATDMIMYGEYELAGTMMRGVTKYIWETLGKFEKNCKCKFKP